MTKSEELKAAYEAATKGRWRQKSWHEGAILDDEGRVIGAAYVPHDAAFIAQAHNTMPQLLEVGERLEAMQRVIGELASTNPFLVGEFEKNKTVLEKLK